jgi:predicted PurR-regulated permease PerM
MPGDSDPDYYRMHRTVLVLLALGISALFLWMIHEFLTALLFAAILSGLFYPLYRRLVRRFNGRRSLASAATLGVVVLVVIIPLVALLAAVASQAVQLGQEARPWVEEQIRRTPEIRETFENLPLVERLSPYREEINAKLAELAGRAGSFAVSAITAAARETVSFLFMLFVMLYSMFFFLIDGRKALAKMLYYLPLPAADETRMLGKFLSVTRATIKGTIVIGAVQGTLAGLAFWVAGIRGAALWGTLMAVLSVIPGLGPAIIWVPGTIFLALMGHWTASIALFVWCAAVVGTVDNLLRPWLVGKDTQLPDLLIMLSTLGGLILFGATGFVTGPIIAALFVTVWDLYGTAFKDVLPEADSPPSILPPAVREDTDRGPSG